MLDQNYQFQRLRSYRSLNETGVLSDITNIARSSPVKCIHNSIIKNGDAAKGCVAVPEKCADPHAPALEVGVSDVSLATKCASSSSAATISDAAETGRFGELELVQEYLRDFGLRLQQAEIHSIPQPCYMDSQKDINPRMRKILVNWLADVNESYKLRPETLFLAVNVVDRYLMQRTTTRRNFQLVGLTALLIAAKFGECNPPTIQDLAAMADKTYTEDEIAKMELSILVVLEFKIFQPTSWDFLTHYQCFIACTDAEHNLALRVLMLSLSDYKMIQYSPSHLAAAVFLVTKKLRQQQLPPTFSEITGKTEEVLKGCAKEVCGLLENSDPTHWHQKLQRASKRPRQNNSSLSLPEGKRLAPSVRTR